MDLRKINDLILAANDASNLARSLIAGFLLVALMMAAMVVGTSDEAMLRNSLQIAPTLGISVSVSVAHLFAPIILVFLHVGALIQLDVVGERLRDLKKELSVSSFSGSELDHQWARIHALARMYLLTDQEKHVPTGTLLRIVTWLTMVGTPIAVLLALQIGFLRYQSSPITFVQQVVFVLDVAALRWFLLRLKERHHGSSLQARTARLLNASFLCLGLIVSIVIALPLTGDENVRNVRWTESYTYAESQESKPRLEEDVFPDETCTVHKSVSTVEISFLDVYFWPALTGCNLLDTLVCPYLDWNWGCRFLRLSHTKLVADDIPRELIERLFTDDAPIDERSKSPGACWPERGISRTEAKANQLDAKARKVTAKIENLGVGGTDQTSVEKAEFQFELATIEAEQVNAQADWRVTQMWVRLVGLRLRSRNFRFADFENSSLYGIDLVYGDLRGANLEGANMQWSWLDGADLGGAVLDDAHLEHTSLVEAVFTRASLRETHLYHADLTRANLKHAALNRSDLTRAKMNKASLEAALIKSTVLVSADLSDALLDGASLKCSNLQNAKLVGASLIKTDLANINSVGMPVSPDERDP